MLDEVIYIIYCIIAKLNNIYYVRIVYTAIYRIFSNSRYDFKERGNVCKSKSRISNIIFSHRVHFVILYFSFAFARYVTSTLSEFGNILFIYIYKIYEISKRVKLLYVRFYTYLYMGSIRDENSSPRYKSWHRRKQKIAIGQSVVCIYLYRKLYHNTKYYNIHMRNKNIHTYKCNKHEY